MNTDAYTRTALSVSELNREAKVLLEGHFDRVTVEGEIGNFTAASSGHWYFSLKDADAQVRCAMFRGPTGGSKCAPLKVTRCAFGPRSLSMRAVASFS